MVQYYLTTLKSGALIAIWNSSTHLHVATLRRGLLRIHGLKWWNLIFFIFSFWRLIFILEAFSILHFSFALLPFRFKAAITH